MVMNLKYLNRYKNKDKLYNMFKTQAKNINRKMREFRKEGIDDFSTMVNNMLEGVKLTKNGNVSLSKKDFKSNNILMMKKFIKAMDYINTHPTLGTVHKYRSAFTVQEQRLIDYAEEFLRNKGYSEEFIIKVTRDKNFLATCFDEFKNKAKSYDSDSIIEKVALSYGEGLVDEKTAREVINNIEDTQKAIDEIIQRDKDIDEYLRYRNGEIR